MYSKQYNIVKKAKAFYSIFVFENNVDIVGPLINSWQLRMRRHKRNAIATDALLIFDIDNIKYGKIAFFHPQNLCFGNLL